MRLYIKRIVTVALLGVVALLLQIFVKGIQERQANFADSQAPDGGVIKIVHASDAFSSAVTCSGSSCTF